jgi:hypothetical protein
MGRARFFTKGKGARKDTEWMPGKNQPVPPPGGGLSRV